MAGEAKIDPMHQFTIEPLIPLHIGGIDVSLTNSSAWMLITLALIFLFVLLGMKRELVPGRWQMAVEGLTNFIDNMVQVNIGPEGKPYIPLIFSLFAFILVSNMLGLLPDRDHSRPAPLHDHKPIQHHGRSRRAELLDGRDRRLLAARAALLLLFVPHGTPAVMVPLIAAIEFISFMVRPFSLGTPVFRGDDRRAHSDGSVRQLYRGRVDRQRGGPRGGRAQLPVHRLRRRAGAADVRDPGLCLRAPDDAVSH